MLRSLLPALALVLGSSLGCVTEPDAMPDETAGLSASTDCATDEPILFDNPTGGPNALYGSYARTWRYFGTAQCRAPFDFGRALSALGWPLTPPRDTGSDQIQVFERVKMNAGGGCPYGACLSFAGIDDAVRTSGQPMTEGGPTPDCNRPGLMRRSVDCLPGELRAIYEANGGLEFYGFPISTVQDCGWWDFGPVGTRQCVWTERAKLGRFPENGGLFRWQGESLGLKASVSGDVPGTATLRACDNFAVSNAVFNPITRSGSFSVRNECGEHADVSYTATNIQINFASPTGATAFASFAVNPVTHQVGLISNVNAFVAKPFFERAQEAEAAGRMRHDGIGGRCFVSMLAMVGGALALAIPPPAGEIIAGVTISAGLGGAISFCPVQ